MLKLGLDLSLSSIRPQGVWSPDDEATLVAWWQKGVGITLNAADVSQWDDSSPNGHDMAQATASEQPAYSSGVLTFDQSNDNNLVTGSQISLGDDFTVGIKISPTSPVADAGTFLADNTTSGELFKYQTNSRITVKIDGSAATNLDLDSGTFGDDYLVITRRSDVFQLYQNGTGQTGTTPTLSGTADIDCIGIRKPGIDPFDGTIEEIQIYSSSSATLTRNINDRLSTL